VGVLFVPVSDGFLFAIFGVIFLFGISGDNVDFFTVVLVLFICFVEVL